ncbi:PEP/pyruvate-binding domain-containing protein, partial [Bacillus cereus group sp. BC233]
LEPRRLMLIGPGRWGTSTTALGVPVSFAEIRPASVLVEGSDPAAGFSPELSFGSHFFQDLVEQGIFFLALHRDRPSVVFNPDRVLSRPN